MIKVRTRVSSRRRLSALPASISKKMVSAITAPSGNFQPGGAPGAPATYVGMCHIFSDSVESFQAAMGKHAKEIMGDIPNYTDIAPVIQISEVVVG